MGAHEAGALHAPGYGSIATVPAWLSPPQRVDELLAPLWSRTTRRSDDGALEVGGISVSALAAEYGTAAYILDEADFRDSATAFRDGFNAAFADLAGADVYYAGKAFLCTAVVQWLVEDGLNLDVCSAGELAIAMRGGMPGERITMHGNNKSLDDLRAALQAGVGRIVIDSEAEIDRIVQVAQELGRTDPVGVMIRVTVGIEAHTHEYMATSHEDQKFGLSLASGAAFDAAARIAQLPELKLLGLHMHIGSQIFDTEGFDVAAHRLLGLHARVAQDLGVAMPEVDFGGGYGIAYTSEHDPMEPAQIAKQFADIVRHETARLGIAAPRVSVEPGRAIAGRAGMTLYTVGTIKDVPTGPGVWRRYVSVDGGMSDNIRTALYDADYSCTIASRGSDSAGVLSRVVGKHCESGDIIVKDEFLPEDLAAGDLIAVPGTGAYCRSMASQYNHALRPPVIAVRDGKSRVIVRRETMEDLLALDAP